MMLLTDLHNLYLNAKRRKLEKCHFFIDDETGKIIVTKKERKNDYIH